MKLYQRSSTLVNCISDRFVDHSKVIREISRYMARCNLWFSLLSLTLLAFFPRLFSLCHITYKHDIVGQIALTPTTMT